MYISVSQFLLCRATEARVHASLGYVYELLKDTDKAIDHYEQVFLWCFLLFVCLGEQYSWWCNALLGGVYVSFPNCQEFNINFMIVSEWQTAVLSLGDYARDDIIVCYCDDITIILCVWKQLLRQWTKKLTFLCCYPVQTGPLLDH